MVSYWLNLGMRRNNIMVSSLGFLSVSCTLDRSQRSRQPENTNRRRLFKKEGGGLQQNLLSLAKHQEMDSLARQKIQTVTENHKTKLWPYLYPSQQKPNGQFLFLSTFVKLQQSASPLTEAPSDKAKQETKRKKRIHFPSQLGQCPRRSGGGGTFMTAQQE